jgi:hypothetical protein
MSAISRLRSEVRRDRREIARDKREVSKDRGELRKDLQELRKDLRSVDSNRKTLVQTRKAEARALAAIDKERAATAQQYEDSFDPSDPSSTGDPALKARLDQLDARRTATDDRFNDKIAAVVDRLQQKRNEVTRGRKEVKDDRRELKKDRKELAKDLRELRKDKARLKRAIAARGKKVTAYVNGSPRTIRVVPVGGGEYLRADAAAAYKKMVAAAARAGIRLTPTSGFRTMAEQQALWNQYGPPRAAPPGYSNHQNGIAMDIGGIGGRGTRADAWLRNNAGRFGFRNLPSEFWHYDFVR